MITEIPKCQTCARAWLDAARLFTDDRCVQPEPAAQLALPPIEEIEASKPKTFAVPRFILEDFEAGLMTWSDLLECLRECARLEPK